MKFYYYAVVLVGLSFLMTAAGFNTPVAGGLLKQLGVVDSNDNPTLQNLTNSGFWNDLDLILAGLGTAAVVIGVFGRAPDINLLSAGLVLALSGAIIADYLSIYSRLLEFHVEWVSWVGTLIFAGILVGFFITAIEYWRGSD